MIVSKKRFMLLSIPFFVVINLFGVLDHMEICEEKKEDFVEAPKMLAAKREDLVPFAGHCKIIQEKRMGDFQCICNALTDDDFSLLHRVLKYITQLYQNREGNSKVEAEISAKLAHNILLYKSSDVLRRLLNRAIDLGDQILLGALEDLLGFCCPICLEDLCSGGTRPIRILPCNHFFHLNCIDRWREAVLGNNKCPNCRGNIGDVVSSETIDDCLREAVALGNIPLVKRLLFAGANVNAKGLYGSTLLHCAVMKGFPEIVGILIADGANVNAENEKGNTPLHVAAAHNRRDIGAKLLLAGGNVNAQSYRDRTPLHIAVEHASKEMMYLLLSVNDVNVEIEDDRFETPILLAQRHGRSDMVEALMRYKVEQIHAKSDYLIPIGCSIQ